jgi:cell wall-associated NlpC family hydrolase
MSLVRTSSTQRPGKHRAEVTHHGRRAAATVALAAGLAAGPALTSPASAADYTVQSGDTLSSIAQSMGTSWQDLYAANRDVVSSPTTIYPGQTLQTGGGSSSSSQAAPAAPSSAASGVVEAASQYAGVPYVYGGSTPSGFDCSGFTSYVFAQAGKTIPRTSAAQAAAATPVSADNLQPGDLIFYSPGGSVSHVAIYAGDGMVWEAPGTGGSVQYAPIWDVERSYGRF